MSEGPNKRPPNPWMKNLGLWIVILLGLAVAVNVMQGTGSSRSGDTLAYSDFLARVDDGAVKSVEIRGEEIIGRTSGDEEFRTFNPGDTQLIERLRTKGVRFDARPEESRSVIAQLFFNMLPFILMIGIWIFVMRQMQNGAGRGAMGFGKSRAKLLVQKEGRVTFDDVAGIDDTFVVANGDVLTDLDLTAAQGEFSVKWFNPRTGGDFMKYDEAERIGPPMPRSLAIFAARIASSVSSLSRRSFLARKPTCRLRAIASAAVAKRSSPSAAPGIACRSASVSPQYSGLRSSAPGGGVPSGSSCTA